jgi:putative ABC transport system permease protein
MLRLSIRNLLAHKIRFAMTTFAVVMGVGFVVGSFVVTDSLRRSVDTLFTEIMSGVDVSVRAETNLSTASMASRGRVSAELEEVVQGIEGVEAAEGMATGYAQLIDLDGEPLTTTGAPFLGLPWGDEERFYPATLEDGRDPKGKAEVVIDRGTAEDYGFEVGDRTRVILADGTQPEVEIVGIFTFGEANNLLGARLTAFDAEVAPEVFGMVGEFDSIDVIAEEGVDTAALAARIEAAMPDGVEAVVSATVRSEANEVFEGFLTIFQNVLLGFAGVALFVSAFFINNTFSIVLGQRTRELALLRSLGASPAQITRSVLLEAITVGLLASAIGVGFGMLIATVLQALLDAAGMGLPTQALVLTSRTLVAAAVVGLGVTLIASVAPARRSSRVPPVEGMRSGYVVTRWSRSGRAAGGVATVAAGATLVVAGLFVIEDTMPVVGALSLGAILVFIGVAQLSPVLAVPVAGAIGRPVAPLLRVAGRLAHANAVRNPERTAKTASALMIGLALVTTVFIVGTSMKRSFANALDDTLAADFILSTPGMTGFSPTVIDELAKLPEVGAVTGARGDRFLFEGEERDVNAVSGRHLSSMLEPGLLRGSLADIRKTGIAIHQDVARDHGLDTGDTVTVELAVGGPRELVVEAIYADSTFVGNYLIDLELFEEGYPLNNRELYGFVKLALFVDPAEGRAAIERAIASQPQIVLEDRQEFREAQEAQFNGILIAVNGLLGLALFIAVLGIANTLALSVLERTREIGLLRAVGMLRSQAREMVLAESAMVAVFGAALGVGVGVVFGVAATVAMPDSFIATTAIPWATIGIIVVAAAVCGLVAGVLPARRAAKLDVLTAIQSE